MFLGRNGNNRVTSRSENRIRFPSNSRSLTRKALTAVKIASTIRAAGAQQELVFQYKKGQDLAGLDDLLEAGTIDSYRQTKDSVIIDINQATDRAAVAKALETPAAIPVLEKAKQLFIPPDMSESVAPEYLKFRGWSLAGAVLGGALGFLNTQINLRATNASFSSVESAALAGTISGYLGTASAMGASYLAKRGDADPKRAFATASLMQTANTIGLMAGLTVLPTRFVPISFSSVVVGSVAGAIGSSAGINIGNHIAKEHARGVVGAKNANQDRFVGFFGVPLALAVTRGVKATGLPMDPTLASIGLLGSALLLCNIQAANSLHFEGVDRGKLEELVSALGEGKSIPQAPSSGFIGTLKEVFVAPTKEEGKVEHLLDPTPLLQNERLAILAKEDYLVGLSPQGKVQLAFRKNVGSQALLKGMRQALILESLKPHLSLAEKVAPGKAELALTELSYRALNFDGDWRGRVADAGWHLHAQKLEVGCEQQWRAKAGELSPVTESQFKSFRQNPSEESLKALIAGGPVLP